MRSKSTMTLDRVLSRFGLASRTAAQEVILAGRIKINGRIIRDPDLWVRPGKDVVHVDGKRLRQTRKIHLLFYKPKGVITSHGDPKNRTTVYDYLGEQSRWVSPVGRLDKDTSGLLLLTNDTEFANRITDPAYGIPKTYLAKLDTIIPEEALAALSGRRSDEARRLGATSEHSAAGRSGKTQLAGNRADRR